MKLKVLSIVLLALMFLPSVAHAELLYGDCMPVKGTEFYRCLSIDGQETYTNSCPDASMTKKYKSAKAQRDKKLAERAALAARAKELLVPAPVIVRVPPTCAGEIALQVEAWTSLAERYMKGEKSLIDDIERAERAIAVLAELCQGK